MTTKDKKVTSISGSAIVHVVDELDTDRIIPARFLETTTFDDLGPNVFCDDRKKLNGQHPFDQSENQDAEILITGKNFGCGSSREHAPQALMRWNKGIKAIIAPSFAEIFYGNCRANGVPCLVVSESNHAKLVKAIKPTSRVQIRLESNSIIVIGFGGDGVPTNDCMIPFELPDSDRQAFLDGKWDPMDQLLESMDEIEALEADLPPVELAEAA